MASCSALASPTVCVYSVGLRPVRRATWFVLAGLTASSLEVFSGICGMSLFCLIVIICHQAVKCDLHNSESDTQYMQSAVLPLMWGKVAPPCGQLADHSEDKNVNESMVLSNNLYESFIPLPSLTSNHHFINYTRAQQ